MAKYELTDAQRTIANSRVSLDEAMIAMVTDKLFRIFTLFILLICYFLFIAFYSFTIFYCHCIFDNECFFQKRIGKNVCQKSFIDNNNGDPVLYLCNTLYLPTINTNTMPI